MKIKKEYLALAMLGAGAAAIAISISSYVSIPKNAKAVEPFDKASYLGTWFEIARLDFRFEKALDHVTATYSLNTDGTIRVDNRGYDVLKKQWKESIGKARFVKDDTLGRLKVSFFGPFYAGYNVIAIDPGYRYAMVAGNNLGYLWLLSREKSMPESIRNRYLRMAGNLGYRVDQLVWTNQR